FFGCLKKRGFCFEDTHLTHLPRIETLIFVLTVAFCWSHLVGEVKEKEIPTKTKSHGRKAKSTFRCGFDVLRGIFLRLGEKIEAFASCLKLLIINHQSRAA
ncbi:MAG: IS4 family transposase, partial [Chlamydiia bacterium]|nr:IS4 family transposase [Chlamydiia bacterium]